MATSEIVSPSSDVSQALCDSGRKQTITTAIVWQTLDDRQHGGAITQSGERVAAFLLNLRSWRTPWGAVCYKWSPTQASLSRGLTMKAKRLELILSTTRDGHPISPHSKELSVLCFIVFTFDYVAQAGFELEIFCLKLSSVGSASSQDHTLPCT